jgi:hypothetical protein
MPRSAGLGVTRPADGPEVAQRVVRDVVVEVVNLLREPVAQSSQMPFALAMIPRRICIHLRPRSRLGATGLGLQRLW